MNNYRVERVFALEQREIEALLNRIDGEGFKLITVDAGLGYFRRRR